MCTRFRWRTTIRAAKDQVVEVLSLGSKNAAMPTKKNLLLSSGRGREGGKRRATRDLNKKVRACVVFERAIIASRHILVTRRECRAGSTSRQDRLLLTVRKTRRPHRR